MNTKFKYNFINLNGEIISTNNLSTIKKGLSWNILNGFMPIWNFKKEEKDFLNKWGLSSSVFNVGCIHNIKMVYLPEYFYNNILELKGFLSCEICNIKKESVRFEGSEEKNICDNCLYKLKGGLIK